MGKYDYFINIELIATELTSTTTFVVSTRFVNGVWNLFVVEYSHCLPMKFFFVWGQQRSDAMKSLEGSLVHRSDYR